jgi:hypothetical protein
LPKNSKNFSFSPCWIVPVCRSKPSRPYSPRITGMFLAVKALYMRSNAPVRSACTVASKR